MRRIIRAEPALFSPLTLSSLKPAFWRDWIALSPLPGHASSYRRRASMRIGEGLRVDGNGWMSGAQARLLRDEARDSRQRVVQNLLRGTRCRQLHADHCFHLDDARGDFDEA